MSCTRNCSGSSSDANIPVISSDIAAICSPVARSAAKPAMAISNERRASNISAGVNRWSEAIRRKGLESSAGGPSASTTKVPAPRRAADADRSQRTDSRTQCRPADTQQFCEISFGRQSITGTQLALMNHFAQLRYHFFESRTTPFRIYRLEKCLRLIRSSLNIQSWERINGSVVIIFFAIPETAHLGFRCRANFSFSSLIPSTASFAITSAPCAVEMSIVFNTIWMVADSHWLSGEGTSYATHLVLVF